MQYYFFRVLLTLSRIGPAPSANNKQGGKLLSGPDRVIFVIATIVYSSSPPLIFSPRFWEPRDQPQPGFQENHGEEVGGVIEFSDGLLTATLG